MLLQKSLSKMERTRCVVGVIRGKFLGSKRSDSCIKDHRLSADAEHMLLSAHIIHHPLIKLRSCHRPYITLRFGCGVIGLSTALALLEDQSSNGRSSNCLVTIVSKEVPIWTVALQDKQALCGVC